MLFRVAFTFALILVPLASGSANVAERPEDSAARLSESLLHKLVGENLRGLVPRVSIKDHPLPFATARKDGLIVISLELFRVSSDPSVIAFVIAHELAHLHFGHTHGENRESHIESELLADDYALKLLADSNFSLEPLIPFMEGLQRSLRGFPSLPVRVKILQEKIREKEQKEA